MSGPEALPAPEGGRTLLGVPGAVVALGAVSLLTDLSSEMIYPLLPLFLTTVLGAGAVALGAVEGVAEATASLVKLASGAWSDRARRRKPLVVAGYALAGLARPLIGAAGSWATVLALRFADRVGKGLRTAPRDALIADLTRPGRRGAAFGLHRGMDHAGAVAGPLVAAALLQGAGLPLRTVFFLAAVPAAATLVVLALAVREAPRADPSPPGPGRPAVELPSRQAWRRLDPGLRRLLAAVALFTLGNSTDAFLLLRLSHAGLAAGWVAALWSGLHVVKMLAAVAGGRLSDRHGRRLPLVAGWGLYAAVYGGFAVASSAPTLVALFLVYGLYFGLTEPAERAWVADLAAAGLRGTALGAYHAAVGLAALPASLVFGLLWSRFGAPAAFLTGAGLALAAALLLLRVPEPGGRGSAAPAGAAV